eukprot:TRINITY_DN871_c0_g1_i1.p1 TRINITY_DN871_c0_g1~~TRINITY_DN871_c0_g1_i1.p1  ORF type:complete len:179 (-),score=22.78 TRINITY_DN871_c0_g1_i1:481-1017(-)
MDPHLIREFEGYFEEFETKLDQICNIFNHLETSGLIDINGTSIASEPIVKSSTPNCSFEDEVGPLQFSETTVEHSFESFFEPVKSSSFFEDTKLDIQISMQLEQECDLINTPTEKLIVQNIAENTNNLHHCSSKFSPSKRYRCRDCGKPFTRKGDRNNHELRLKHRKWAKGKIYRSLF